MPDTTRDLAGPVELANRAQTKKTRLEALQLAIDAGFTLDASMLISAATAIQKYLNNEEEEVTSNA